MEVSDLRLRAKNSENVWPGWVVSPSEKRVCPNALKSGENDSSADMLSYPHAQNTPIKTLTDGLRR